MKKLGIVIFILAIILGYLAASLTSYGNIGGYMPQFSLNFGKVKGSGNVITEQRNVRDFSKISASGIFTIDVAAGSDFSVLVEADDNIMPLVNTEISNGELKLSTERGIRSATRLHVKITMPNVDGIKTSGVAKAKIENVNSNELTLRASGSSQIELSGTANELSARASGSSRINADSLLTQTSDVRTSGSSRIDLSVTNSLTAKSSGASRVNYSGSPAYVDPDTSGSAKISAK